MASPGTRYALKRLTRSDLTFFKHHYEQARAGNPTSSAQKSINLNSDVFISEIYPGLIAGTNIPIALSIAGPTGDDYQRLMRKIVRSPSSKNWRLNGEFVPDPEDDGTRYHELRDGDLAFFSFDGDQQPSAVSCLLVSASQNAAAHEALNALLEASGRSMMSVDPHLLRTALADLSDEVAFPLSLLSESALLDELVEGGGAVKLPGLGPTLSAADLEDRRRHIAFRGRIGEATYAHYLDGEVEGGRLESYEWVSLTRAVAPLDFQIVRNGVQIDVEVKTTAQAFETPFHLSIGEARRLIQRGDKYEVVRIYELTDSAARCRTISGLADDVERALTRIDALPEGFGVDSLSVDVRKLGGAIIGDEVALSTKSGPGENV